MIIDLDKLIFYSKQSKKKSKKNWYVHKKKFNNCNTKLKIIEKYRFYICIYGYLNTQNNFKI